MGKTILMTTKKKEKKKLHIIAMFKDVTSIRITYHRSDAPTTSFH
jgi:hypothetical protein